jgi:hypothetical protein
VTPPRAASRRFPPFYDDDPLGIYQKILEGKIKFPWVSRAAAVAAPPPLLAGGRRCACPS